MAQPLIVSLPPNLQLWGGCQLRVTALDPATGAAVSGVKAQNLTFEVVVLAAPASARLNPVLLLRKP